MKRGNWWPRGHLLLNALSTVFISKKMWRHQKPKQSKNELHEMWFHLNSFDWGSSTDALINLSNQIWLIQLIYFTMLDWMIVNLMNINTNDNGVWDSKRSSARRECIRAEVDGVDADKDTPEHTTNPSLIHEHLSQISNQFSSLITNNLWKIDLELI